MRVNGKYKMKKNIVLLVSLAVILSHVPTLLAASTQSWWKDGILDKVSPMQLIQIRNGLDPGETVSVRCLSKDDDLGTHQLRFRQSFAWKFRSSYWGTQFFCTIKWRHYYKDFIVYSSNSLLRKGNGKNKSSDCSITCVWSVKHKFIKSPTGAMLMWKKFWGCSCFWTFYLCNKTINLTWFDFSLIFFPCIDHGRSRDLNFHGQTSINNYDLIILYPYILVKSLYMMR